MKKKFAITARLTILMAIAFVPAFVRADTITLLANDALGTSSFTGSTNWSNDAVPGSGNDYFTGSNVLRTPQDTGSATTYTFGGNSLTLQTPNSVATRSLLLKSVTGDTFIINNFTNSGSLINQGSGTAAATFGGNILCIAANSAIWTDQGGVFTINSPLAGSANWTNGGSAQIIYNGTNSAFNGRFVVINTATLTFNSVSNVPGNPASFIPDQFILGAGTTFRDNAGVNLNNSNGGITLAGNATINTATAGLNTVIAMPITGAGTLTKSGAGTLILAAANTYTNATIVSDGILLLTGSISGIAGVIVSGGNLSGNGVINDNVTVQSGGTLSPSLGLGNIDTLAINGNLTLAGATAMDINKTAATSDLVTGLTGVAYGGTLAVNNLSGTLTTNDTFTLFSPGASASNFAGIIGSPGAGLAYSFTNGVLSIVSTVSNPTNITYSVPASPRVDINLDPGWKFIQQDVAGAQTNGFDDSSWTNINLPHTWDIADGQDGPATAYYQGIGWYRLHFTADASYTNREIFLKFDGAFLVADVYLNGNYLGEHDGGFAAFDFDVTPYLNIGGDNVLAVKVNNAVNANVPPLEADFTFWGGIYRGVHLLVTDPLQISPLDYASPGIYLKPTNVSSTSANLQVTTVVSNANPVAANVTVRAVITDAATNIVAILTNVLVLPADSISNVVTSTIIANPHLWNGLADPYLYHAYVELYNGTNLTDLVCQPLGFRWFRIDPTNGFFLNGQHYDLHGVAMHQDWLNSGWALTNAQRDTNFMIIKELGATAVRLCHYEHDDYTYQLADQDGIILWSEIPLIDHITQSSAFYTNAGQQLHELIRQRYNHPSVICWGVFNEITLVSGPSPDNLVSNLVQEEAQEDSTRPSAGATLAGNGDATSWMPQVVAFNEYYGWYESPLNGIASWSDNIHAAHPTNAIGITEYGAGASIYQHSENPVAWPTTTGGLYHPEEWQDIVHETNYALMKARPSLWIKTAWNLFDFASDGRDEGDTPGRNDKGLVTYDRKTRKDIFYFYKAQWTTNPMVYITGHTFTNRLTNFITAKIYANCDSVQLFVNGVSQGSKTSGNFIFTWPVTLVGGSNYVQAVGTKGATNVTDSLTWFTPIGLTITSPLASVVYLNSTNDTLQLAAAITNSSQPFAPAWSQVSGPGTAAFGNSSSLATTVNFNAAGIYGLNITAGGGAASASAQLSVVVGTNNFVTNGLNAWWKMDETGGATAFDSSGNGRNAALTGATFTTGYLSNALQLAGSSGSYGSYSAADGNQVTLAAWVKASGNGGGSYPFIVGSPSYRFIFRFTGTDSSSVGFATFDQVNGDYDSGAGTIGQGAWYHVAVSFDRGNLSTPPVFYINGKKMTTSVLAAPSGTPPPFTGTGYIGNRSDGARGWNGLIDDLRIYNRVLSDAEVQTLAAMPMTNLAPIVNAGTNQTLIWPAAANLAGTVTYAGAVTTLWSGINGPGVVTFGNSNMLVTTAGFSAPGTYQLQLAANDGQETTLGSLAVTLITPKLSLQSFPNAFQLSWPANGGNWLLQYQTNPAATGLGTNWIFLSGTITNPFTTPIDSNAGSVFYRLILTN